MPPGTSTLPVIWKMAESAWQAGTASLLMSTETPHCMIMPSAFAIMRAASTIFSGATQQISAVFSAV